MERIYVVEHPMDEQCLTPQQLLKYQDILKQASEQNVSQSNMLENNNFSLKSF